MQFQQKMTIENKHLEELPSLFNIKSVISSPTCFQSINHTCIDLILANQEDLFSNSNKNSNTFNKTSLYRDYKKFEENKFARDVTH